MKTQIVDFAMRLFGRHTHHLAPLWLLLWLSPGLVQAATRTWTGGSPASSQWNYMSNWEGGQVPQNGDDLVFPAGAARLVNTNTYTDRRFRSITVSTNGYSIRGNSITLSNGISATYLMGLSTLHLPITLGASQTFQCSSVLGAFVVVGDIDLGGHTLTVQGDGSMHFDGVIGGLGDLTKEGSGSLWLGGAHMNTYRGVTRVNAGELYLNKSAAQALAIAQLIIGDGVGAATEAQVWLRQDDQFGVVFVTVNSDGWLNLYDFDDFVSGVTLDGGAVSSDAGTLTVAEVTVSSSGGTVSGKLAVESAPRTFEVASGGNLLVNAVISGGGGITKTGGGFLTLQGSNTYSGQTVVSEGFVEVHSDTGLGSTNGETWLQPAGTLRLVSATVAGELLECDGGRLQAIGANSGWTGPVTLTSSNTIDVPNAGQLLTLSGLISGSGGFTKAGNGVLRLSGSEGNNYDGDTLVRSGTLELGKTAGTGVAIRRGRLTIGDGIGGSSADVVRFIENNQLWSTVPVTIASSGLLDLNGHADTVGALTFLGGRATSGAAGGMLYLANTVTATNGHGTLQGNVTVASTRTFNAAEVSGANLYVQAIVTGSGGLTKTGPGHLYLSSSNSYQGLTTITAGRIYADHDFALGATNEATVVQDGAALVLRNDTHIGQEALTLNGNGQGSLGALASIYGSNSWTGPITLASPTRLTTLQTYDYLHLSGAIDGTGGITLEGAGTVVFSGANANTFSGNTVVNGGTLLLDKTVTDGAVRGPLRIGNDAGGAGADIVRLGRANQIANATDVVVSSSGLFDLNGYFDRINAVTGHGTISLGSGHLVAGHSDSSFRFDGLIFGTGYLWKVGAGTWTLTADNTYSGTTRIETGTLLIKGSQQGSDVDVLAAGWLGGTGVVGQITSQGQVAPGGSTGRLRAANTQLSSGSTFAVELNGPVLATGYDQLDLKGTADLTGATLAVSLGYLPAVGDSFTILNNDGTDAVTGTFAGLPNGASLTVSNATFRINYDGGTGNDVVLRVTKVTPIEPLRIISWKTSGGDLELRWTGGVPFYVVERKTAVANGTWSAVTVPMRETNTNLPVDASAAFFRVKGGN